jgi:alpha-tubulin suppressor-like RCC1 family protein
MAVACGWAHTLALAERGCQVFACGCGDHGQLGAGTRENQRTPAPVAGLEGLPDVVMVAAGYYHSAAMTSAGRLLLRGRNHFGQLGQGDQEIRLVPVTLGPPQFGGAPVAMVACGCFHTLVVTRAGQLFAFGSGFEGQLGLGDRSYRNVPVEVGLGRFGGAVIAYAAAGSYHSGVVTSGGGVWTWGWGVDGCLGQNDKEDLYQLVPKELVGQFDGACALSLAAGAGHTMVLTTCGVVWGCGGEKFG